MFRRSRNFHPRGSIALSVGAAILLLVSPGDRTIVGGKLSLGRGLPRGTYTLQVSVAPQSGKDRDRQASQWVDFEVR